MSAELFYAVAPFLLVAVVVGYLTYLLMKIGNLKDGLSELAAGLGSQATVNGSLLSGVSDIKLRLDELAAVVAKSAASAQEGELAISGNGDQPGVPEIVRRDGQRAPGSSSGARGAALAPDTRRTLQQEVERLSSELAKSKDTIRRYRASVGPAAAERADLSSRNADLKKRLSRMEAERVSASAKADLLAGQIAELEKASSSGAISPGDLSTLEQQLGELRAGRADLLERVRAMQEDMGRMQVEKDFIEQQFVELSERDKPPADDATTLALQVAQKDLEELRKTHQGATEALAATKTMLERVQQEKDFIEQQFVQLSQQGLAQPRPPGTAADGVEFEALRKTRESALQELAALRMTLERVQQEKDFIEEQFIALTSNSSQAAK